MNLAIFQLNGILATRHLVPDSRNPGQAESAVKIAMKQPDPSLALMVYRSTPVASTCVIPAELALGRKIRTTLPMLPQKLEPKTHDQTQIKQHHHEHQESVKKNLDQSHGARHLPEIQPNDSVVVKLNNDSDWSIPGRIKEKLQEPRSYLVATPKGILRRNREHLMKAPTSPWQPENHQPLYQYIVSTPQTPKEPIRTTSAPINVKAPKKMRTQTVQSNTDDYRTRSGRLVRRPARYNE